MNQPQLALIEYECLCRFNSVCPRCGRDCVKNMTWLAFVEGEGWICCAYEPAVADVVETL